MLLKHVYLCLQNFSKLYALEKSVFSVLETYYFLKLYNTCVQQTRKYLDKSYTDLNLMDVIISKILRNHRITEMLNI